MLSLEPSLIVSTGLPCTGKTSILKYLSQKISNSFYLDRDSINRGILYVACTDSTELPPIKDYVADDDVIPDNSRMRETMFGQMLQIFPRNGYHRRHARDQTHLVQAEIVVDNLSLDKVPIIDCFGIRQVREGVHTRFMNHSAFDGYRKSHIHFVLDEDEYYDRVQERAKVDEEAAIRDQDILTSREDFREAFEKRHGKMIPDQLKGQDFLLLDGSGLSTKECSERIIEYISS